MPVHADQARSIRSVMGNNMLKIGKYRHYKGKDYEVIGVAKHTETLEAMVVYRALYDSPDFGKDALWVRPLAMFIEDIEIDGIKKPRFEHIGE